MTNTEIKKLYTATKKALEKRTGEKFTWVMNTRQQRLGTATICCAMAHDYEDRLHWAEKSLAGFEKFWADRMADYNKRAREEAWKNKHTPGWFFGKNYTYWEDIVADTEKLADDKARELAHREDAVRTEKRCLAEKGTYRETLAVAVAKAEAMIAEPEVQAFLNKIGGSAFVDVVEHNRSATSYAYHCAEVYVRFQYTATEA